MTSLEMGGLRRRRVMRRRMVVALTLVVGAVLLGVSLSVPPGDPRFAVLALALAAVWVAGGLLSGPLPWGFVTVAHVVRPVLIGLGLGAVFLAGALVLPAALRDDVQGVLAYARPGSLAPVAMVTVVNAVAEEVFFRGALFAAVERSRPVLVSSVVYVLTTIATGNPMLVFAAVVVAPVLGWQRRSTGGILAPALIHTTWSLLMLFALPPLLNR